MPVARISCFEIIYKRPENENIKNIVGNKTERIVSYFEKGERKYQFS